MKPNRFSRLRVAGVLPLAVGMMLLFSFTTRQPEIIVAEQGVERPVSAVQNPDQPVIMAEVMPTFEGGDIETFRDWVMKNLKYPKEAFEKNIQGLVVVKFVVERDGSVSTIEQIESPHELLYTEVVRVMSESPRWTPGMQKGEPISVMFILPIKFQLPDPAPDK